MSEYKLILTMDIWREEQGTLLKVRGRLYGGISEFNEHFSFNLFDPMIQEADDIRIIGSEKFGITMGLVSEYQKSQILVNVSGEYIKSRGPRLIAHSIVPESSLEGRFTLANGLDGRLSLAQGGELSEVEE